MSKPPPLAEALETLLDFLDREDTAYMLMGGLAVRTLAIPRPTFDLDLMVAVDEAGAAEFARAADREGFSVDDPHLRGFVDRLAGLAKIAFQVQAADRWIPVDVFLTEAEYQRAAFARRCRHETELGPLWLISAEDLLLHKLLADRPRDRADVADLLLVVGKLDEDYLQSWADRLGVRDRLDKAFRAANG